MNPPVIQDAIAKVAAARDKRYANHPTNAPLNDEYMEMAMAGEFAFGEFCGQMPDLAQRAEGDGGVDFTIMLLTTVDVKTIKQGYQYLLHKVDKPMADLYVLAEYERESKSATLIGWTSRAELKEQEPRTFGHDYLDFHQHRSTLRPMHSLRRRMGHFVRLQE